MVYPTGSTPVLHIAFVAPEGEWTNYEEDEYDKGEKRPVVARVQR